MAALIRFNFRRKGFAKLLENVRGKQSFFLEPLKGPRGTQVEKVIRLGIRRQFEAGGIPKWPKAHPFGNRQPAPITLGGAGGRVAQAWENASAEKGPREVRIRQRDVIALAHHRGATIKPVQDPNRMRTALGVGFGVWISTERLMVGLILPQRAVFFTTDMLTGVTAVVFLGFQGVD